MKLPIRARYGAKNNSHTLIDASISESELPHELMGLTDKPSGSVMPATNWSPSVGCTPIGNWWVLWWSVPDTLASRSGMVKSEVAIWPLDKIGDVDDLLPILSELAGEFTIAIPKNELIATVGKSLVHANEQPIVFSDLNLWPGLIASIWKQLWPSARRNFSARVALSPPQSGESVSPPLIYCIPPENTYHWNSYQIINPQNVCIENDRIAKWFIKNEPIMNEIFTGDELRDLSLKDLKKIARAADRLETLKKEQTVQSAINFIRTIVSIYPSIDLVKKKSSDAYSIINIKLTDSGVEDILSIANFDLNVFLPEINIKTKIEEWVNQHIFELSIDEFSDLLRHLSPEYANEWWQETVVNSLNQSISHFQSLKVDKVILSWLAIGEYDEILLKIVPQAKTIEQRLISATKNNTFSEQELINIRKSAIIRKWSTLHAWTLFQLPNTTEALTLQYSFNGDVDPGLKFLINNLPGEHIIEEALTRDNAEFYLLVSNRTVKEPKLLNNLDVKDIRWLKLWAIHLSNGGKKWTIEKNKNIICQTLLNTMLSINIPENIIPYIAIDLGEVALTYEHRPKLWDRLNEIDREQLISCVSESFIKSLSGNAVIVEKPEQILAEAVLRKLYERKELLPIELVTVLNWQTINIREDRVVCWLKAGNWSLYSKEIGEAISRLRFSKAADEIRNLSKKNIDFKLAYKECKDLCSFNFSFFNWGGMFLNSIEKQKALNEIANICAELVQTSDSLSKVWQRCGGNISLLSQKGNIRDQSLEALTLADKGSLRGGVLIIVKILLEDFPHNKQLKEILEQIDDEFLD